MSPSYVGPGFNKPCETNFIKTAAGAPAPNMGMSAEDLLKMEKHLKEQEDMLHYPVQLIKNLSVKNKKSVYGKKN